MHLSFISVDYEGGSNCVSWAGLRCADDGSFSEFLTTEVAVRLDDTEQEAEFQNLLGGLDLAKFDSEHLSSVLNAQQPERHGWAAGEALAEAFLAEERSIVLPWNMERDKRNPAESSAGADIVGFVGEGDNCRFAFGEVKSSSEKRNPPQVMSGRGKGMEAQLRRLSDDPQLIKTLMRWLFSRVKNTDHQAKLKQASKALLDSGQQDIALFGVLVRDTTANERDLSVCGEKLGREFSNPKTCQLTALYLPLKIDQLVEKIRGEGAS